MQLFYFIHSLLLFKLVSSLILSDYYDCARVTCHHNSIKLKNIAKITL